MTGRCILQRTSRDRLHITWNSKKGNLGKLEGNRLKAKIRTICYFKRYYKKGKSSYLVLKSMILNEQTRFKKIIELIQRGCKPK